jgi:exonuclease SbcD
MRLLHTSDWHLGQSLHQYDRTYEHERFLDWLLDTLAAEQVDALIIAGDIFDNSNPSSSAQSLLYRFLTEARHRVPHLSIVMTAGNHDSPGRLEAPSPFLSMFDAYAVGQVSRSEAEISLDRLVIPLKDRSGRIGAWCVAMPFLRPSDVPRVEESTDPYIEGIETLYRMAIEHAQAKRETGQALIAIGHCHLTGGKTSDDSERRIMIGGAEALSAEIFDDSINYVALGHLHLPQEIGGNPTRRYSGSPLPMSFSEIDYPHQVVLVDLDGEKVSRISEHRVPRRVDLLRVPNKPAALDVVLALLSEIELPERPECEWPYLQVRVHLTQPEPALRVQIETVLQGKPVRLARIETSCDQSEEGKSAPTVSIDELNALAPTDFFTRLYEHRFGQAAPQDLLAAFTELLNTNDEAKVEP